jgi:hypothetical protein
MRAKRSFKPEAFDRLESREVLATTTTALMNPFQTLLPQTTITSPFQGFLNSPAMTSTVSNPFQTLLPRTTITSPSQGFLNGTTTTNPFGTLLPQSTITSPHQAFLNVFNTQRSLVAARNAGMTIPTQPTSTTPFSGFPNPFAGFTPGGVGIATSPNFNQIFTTAPGGGHFFLFV